jgi:hypothetical protein
MSGSHRILLLGLILVLAPTACAKKGEGEICESDSECKSGLSCDKHGQKTGKCRPPHHDPVPTVDAGADATAGSGGSAGTGGTGGTGGSAGAGGADAGPDAAGPDATASADASADTTPDSGLTEACTSYCQCLMQSCAMVSGYPFTASGSCMTACLKLTEQERTCWGKFCTMAAGQMGSAREHTCEHAWGELGNAECQ